MSDKNSDSEHFSFSDDPENHEDAENASPNKEAAVETVKKAAKKKLQNKTLPKSESFFQRKKPNQSSTSDVILQAIKSLDDSKGSSLSAIKKYIKDQNPEYDLQRKRVFILKFLKKAIDDGVLKTKGPGVSGKFKIVSEKPEKKRENAAPSQPKKKKATLKVIEVAKTTKKPVKMPEAEVAAPKKGKRAKHMTEDEGGEVVSKKKKATVAIIEEPSVKSASSQGNSKAKATKAARAVKQLQKTRKSTTVVQVPKSKPKAAKTGGREKAAAGK